MKVLRLTGSVIAVALVAAMVTATNAFAGFNTHEQSRYLTPGSYDSGGMTCAQPYRTDVSTYYPLSYQSPTMATNGDTVNWSWAGNVNYNETATITWQLYWWGNGTWNKYAGMQTSQSVTIPPGGYGGNTAGGTGFIFSNLPKGYWYYPTATVVWKQGSTTLGSATYGFTQPSVYKTTSAFALTDGTYACEFN